MAAAVDQEVSKFRQLQQEISTSRSDLSVLLGQQTENEIVKQEFELLNQHDDPVYKEVGPVLLRVDMDDAKQTVAKRLEFISGEIEKLEKSIKSKEQKANETAQKVQEMQGAMQKVAVEAAMAAAKQEQQAA